MAHEDWHEFLLVVTRPTSVPSLCAALHTSHIRVSLFFVSHTHTPDDECFVAQMVRADPPSAVLHGHVGRNRDLYPRSNALHSACYWVSDRYKFIGIKLAKAGGSSMIKFLKSALCGVQVQGAFNVSASCPDIAVLNHGQREQSDCLQAPPARKWREYFVFVVVRNPYARRASMVRYCGVAGGDLVRGIP